MLHWLPVTVVARCVVASPLAGAISRYYLYRTFDDLDIPLSWNDVEKLAARFDPAGTGLINYAKVGEEVEKISGTLSSHCG